MFSLSGDHSFAHHMSDITAGKYVISRAEKRQKYSPGLCSDCPVDITSVNQHLNSYFGAYNLILSAYYEI